MLNRVDNLPASPNNPLHHTYFMASYQPTVSLSMMTSPHNISKLPTEILHEIACYLSRRTLKTLLVFLHHPLGQIASYIYFAELTLNFGVPGLGRPIYYHWDVTEYAWMTRHEKRTNEILMAIVQDAKFATRVRVLELNSFHIDVLDKLVPQLGACGVHLDRFGAHCMRRSAPF